MGGRLTRGGGRGCGTASFVARPVASVPHIARKPSREPLRALDPPRCQPKPAPRTTRVFDGQVGHFQVGSGPVCDAACQAKMQDADELAPWSLDSVGERAVLEHQVRRGAAWCLPWGESQTLECVSQLIDAAGARRHRPTLALAESLHLIGAQPRLMYDSHEETHELAVSAGLPFGGVGCENVAEPWAPSAVRRVRAPLYDTRSLQCRKLGADPRVVTAQCISDVLGSQWLACSREHRRDAAGGGAGERGRARKALRRECVEGVWNSRAHQPEPSPAIERARARASAGVRPVAAASQQVTGATVRSEARAATPARAMIASTSSSPTSGAPTAAAKASIHSRSVNVSLPCHLATLCPPSIHPLRRRGTTPNPIWVRRRPIQGRPDIF